ncbi:Methyltransferase type 11 [Chloroherpeton thalassium ATCC 35110]|uniref:Methyltransferase type 11 n=1 Tax=Chloroherpeton thalassium (strain ATCC 35110 / GB-78) TaxID=517418 RepID=B3QVY4_CHLT3|nr:methyltransferase domain-containing protein [Chloroherpeton thalassium]ACF14638.1 Methyltransferase type 11 [Chloroherpeton thalassium ATCC 35110]
MSSLEYSETVSTARNYYNSSDADNFYFTIWGGEDIHIGLYESEHEPIFDASRRTVARMASLLPNIDQASHILDIGSGFGGATRFLAKKFGCRVTDLNLSEIENKRNREMSNDQGLGNLIEVVEGSFESIPFPDNSFDAVWSQDAILHSGKREQVVSEVARVLKKGGLFIFTDPMQSDTCPEGVLQPILDRIHLETLASPKFYREAAKKAGLEEVGYEDMVQNLIIHYDRILQETEARESELKETVSAAYIQNMKKGLQHWVDGGKNGHLAWGIFRFKKA